MRRIALLAALYVALVVVANWLAATYTWPVGFGYEAPAGVFAVGLILALRDWVHELRGLALSLGLAYVAGVLSLAIAVAAGWSTLGRIAVASIVAFTVSETVDAFVYEPARKRWPAAGLVVSNVVALTIDSLIFLQLAFGGLAYFKGQWIGKAEMTLLALALVCTRRAVTGGRWGSPASTGA